MVTQLSLFASETHQGSTQAPAATVYRVKRAYCRHKQRHVVFLTKHYAVYRLKELAQMLGLSERQVFGLCRRHGIKKRAPNRRPHPGKQKAHNAGLLLAA